MRILACLLLMSLLWLTAARSQAQCVGCSPAQAVAPAVVVMAQPVVVPRIWYVQPAAQQPAPMGQGLLIRQRVGPFGWRGRWVFVPQSQPSGSK
jgi:hypothetical protein